MSETTVKGLENEINKMKSDTEDMRSKIDLNKEIISRWENEIAENEKQKAAAAAASEESDYKAKIKKLKEDNTKFDDEISAASKDFSKIMMEIIDLRAQGYKIPVGRTANFIPLRKALLLLKLERNYTKEQVISRANELLSKYDPAIYEESDANEKIDRVLVARRVLLERLND